MQDQYKQNMRGLHDTCPCLLTPSGRCTRVEFFFHVLPHLNDVHFLTGKRQGESKVMMLYTLRRLNKALAR